MPKMKAAFFDGDNAMMLADIAAPEPGPEDVVIRVRSTGICGSDLLLNADKTEPDAIPFGHEVAGEIVEGRQPGSKRPARTTSGDRNHRARAGLRAVLVLPAGTIPPVPQQGGERGRRLCRVHEAPRHRLLPRCQTGMSWEEGALVEPLGRVGARRSPRSDARRRNRGGAGGRQHRPDHRGGRAGLGRRQDFRHRPPRPAGRVGETPRRRRGSASRRCCPQRGG